MPSGKYRKAVSTKGSCFAGGLARSSDEAPVMGVERRGQVIEAMKGRQPRTRDGSGEDLF